MENSVRQSLLISEESEGLLELPLKTTGRIYLPYSQARKRYQLQQSVESVCAFFGGAVRAVEVRTVLQELEAERHYGSPPLWMNIALTAGVLVMFLLAKALMLLFWFFILLDPLVLIGGFWLIKRLAVLLCVIRLDLLSFHGHKSLRLYLRILNVQWANYGLQWTMEQRGAWLSVGPLRPNL